MKPTFVPHSDYQAFVLRQLHAHTGPGTVLIPKDWPLAVKLWMTDFSAISTLLEPVYSNRGPEPRDPASLLRSYLLLLMTNPHMGITEWINEMQRTPIYATLSGFPLDDLPGVGTFYDFFARLWPAAHKHIKPRKQRRRKGKAKKGKKKGQKAPTTTPGKVERLVKWMMCHADRKTALPADSLFGFFQSHIVSVSAKLGLLGDLSALSTAGDGTPVVTAAFPRSKPSCDCRARGIAECNHLHRIYSQPNCNTGWDSYREKFFNGYHLYMISAADSQHDLPLYPRLQPASRHDAVSLVVSAMEFKQRFALGTVDKMILDAAHDAEAIYLFLTHQGMEPFIDLNVRSKKNTDSKTSAAIKISPKGIPICPNGKEMKPNGADRKLHCRKWRCSPDCGCSTAKYGRTFYTKTTEDPRLFPKTPRDSDKWKLVYKRRTSIERSNKREKVDYHLESGRHRSTQMWYMRIYGIMIGQHIDAWYVSQKDEWDKLKSLFFLATA